MTKRVDALRHEAGFTIIEVLIAMFVLLIGVLAATTMLNTANAETERNQARNGATNLVRDIVEASRALPYEQVNPTIDANGVADNTVITALQGMPPASGGSAGGSSFADASPTSGWQIIRRGVTYTVTLRACVVDDAKDNVVSSHGSPAADGSGYYCPDLATTPTGDPNGDDYRRIKVTAAWTSGSCNSCATARQNASARTYSVTETALIVNPSGGLGPAPIQPPTHTAVDCRTATVSQVYPPSAVAVSFVVTDPDKTTSNQTVPTSVDPATGNKTFSFTYTKTPPQPPDNNYELQIQAVDRTGRGGPITTVTLYINCQQPPDVTGVSGGFDWRRCANYPVLCAAGDRIFDLDWARSPDADVVGYYVWRVNGQPDYTDASNPDTKVACVSRSLQPPNETTTTPGDIDFLEPFQPACYDTDIPDVQSGLFPFPPLLTLLAGQTGRYWIQAVDMQPTNDPLVAPTQVRQTLTNHSNLFTVTENVLNVRPTPPLALSVTNVNGQPCLSWTDSTDVDALGGSILSPIRFYRVYRDTSIVASVGVTVNQPDNTSVSVQVPNLPYKDRVGRSSPNQPGSCDSAHPTRSWFLDPSAPAGAHYWVTAVDQDYLESFPSPSADWGAP